MSSKASKPRVQTAIPILSWLVDMYAPKPRNPFADKPSNEERLTWLRNPPPLNETWLPIHTSMHEPWLLAQAGILETRTYSPAVLKVTKKSSLMQCYPHFRLAPLGRRWCQLLLDSEDRLLEPFFDSLLEQAMTRPDDLPLVGPSIPNALQSSAYHADTRWRACRDCRSPRAKDWAALVLLGKGVAARGIARKDPGRFDLFVETLKGEPA